MLRFHVFVDAGVLSPEYDRLDFEETRIGAGFGIALMYPFPFVFDFGFPLRDQPGDRTQTFAFYLAIR